MLETPEIVTTEERETAVIRLTIPRAEIRQVMGPGITEVMETIKAQGIAPAGAWMTHHFRMSPEVFDFEITVPVASTVAPAGRVLPSRLPSVRAVRAVYEGPYEGLAQAWGEFTAWVAAQGLKTKPNHWEAYVLGPESGLDSSRFRTEFTLPLAD